MSLEGPIQIITRCIERITIEPPTGGLLSLLSFIADTKPTFAMLLDNQAYSRVGFNTLDYWLQEEENDSECIRITSIRESIAEKFNWDTDLDKLVDT